MGMSEMLRWFAWVEYLGVVAFAISGALTGIKKHMDVFGVMTLGLTTATAGGVMRDLILGISPPVMFQKPVYAVIAMITAVIVFLPPVRNRVQKTNRAYETMLFLADTLGLGIFVAVGVRTAIAVMPSASLFLLLFVGTITGVGGGVLRDVLAGQTPYIFVKHIYALACVAGALVCTLLWKTSPVVAMTLGSATVVVIRVCSGYFRWNLPHS